MSRALCFGLLLYLFFPSLIIDSSAVNSTKDRKILEDQGFVFLDSPDDPIVLEPSVSVPRQDIAVFESPTDGYEAELDEAARDVDQRVPSSPDEPHRLDVTDGSLEAALEDAMTEERPTIMESDDSPSVDFGYLSLSHDDDYPQANRFRLDRVASGHLPSGVIKQSYSPVDRTELIRLYRSDRREDTQQLFHFIAQHIHNRFGNCVVNLARWLRRPQVNEPVFYRNCVPCANAVDLNLQSLFDNAFDVDELHHYFVNTCDTDKQWVSYIDDMEIIEGYAKDRTSMKFTDVVQQDLLRNQRYLLRGIIRSSRGGDAPGFFHVCNLVKDDRGHVWIIDGQIERLFDLNRTDHLHELDRRYRPDYVARASTGRFRPTSDFSTRGQTN